MDEYELEEVKREIVESRSLSIKTNNLINALRADVKSITKRQQGYERRLVFNSATTYVVTIVILFAALKFAWNARVDAIRAETQQSREELKKLKVTVASLRKHEEEKLDAQDKAQKFYELIEKGQHDLVLRDYEQVVTLPLTATEQALFRRASARAHNELSRVAYNRGLEASRLERWQDAQKAFAESLKYKANSNHSLRATYQLARTMRALSQQREAIPMLMRLTETPGNDEVADEALLLLAECQLDIEAWTDSKNTLKAFLRKFPKSAFLKEARSKLKEVQLRR